MRNGHLLVVNSEMLLTTQKYVQFVGCNLRIFTLVERQHIKLLFEVVTELQKK